MDAALGAERARGFSDLQGSFNAKTVKGNNYWYFLFTEPSGKLHQLYVGPNSEPVQSLMARKDAPSAAAALGPLARSAMALGNPAVLPRHFRVIRRLADYGFFRGGGVLIGTHAFIAFGNSLGVRWGNSSRTQDIDFAHAGKRLSLLLPNNVEVDTDAPDRLGFGLVERAIGFDESLEVPRPRLVAAGDGVDLCSKSPDVLAVGLHLRLIGANLLR